MRDGPPADREARVSRTTRAGIAPVERLAEAGAVPVLEDGRGALLASTAGESWSCSRVYLGSRLPINLRSFLSARLAPWMHIENDAVVALGPGSHELVMRELARAIRRFSAERARQTWSECAVEIERLERELFRGPGARHQPVILCLQCARIATGPLDGHSASPCLAVNLASAFGASASSQCSLAAPDLVLQAIENFRAAREVAGLPHYDLDCFVANGHAVFTWRPLPMQLAERA